MFRLSIVFLLSALTSFALADVFEEMAVIVLAGSQHATKGPCSRDENKRLNRIMTLASVGSRRMLRDRQRRLDPIACCAPCKNNAQCWIAYPSCSNAPYDKTECPGYRELEARDATPLIAQEQEKLRIAMAEEPSNLLVTERAACTRKIEFIRKAIDRLIRAENPEHLNLECQQLFKERVELLCVKMPL